MAIPATPALLVVRVDDPAGLALRTFPHPTCPRVAVEVASVRLVVDDVTVLEALAVQVSRGRTALLGLQCGHDPGAVDMPNHSDTDSGVERVAEPVWLVAS